MPTPQQTHAWLTRANATRSENKRLLGQAESLLRRLRNDPRLWEDNSAKIDRVLLRAKSRVIRRRQKPTEPYGSPAPRDPMLFLYQ